MDSCSSISSLPSNRVKSNAQSNKDLSQDTGTTELIANLDHGLADVRIRALRCILAKIECGIVSPEILSRRIDLLNRLTTWLRALVDSLSREEKHSTDVQVSNEEALNSLVHLLFLLVQHKTAKDFLVGDNIEDFILHIRNHLSEEGQKWVDAILEILGPGTYVLQYEGSPEIFNDTASNRPSTSYGDSEGNFGLERVAEENEVEFHPRKYWTLPKQSSQIMYEPLASDPYMGTSSTISAHLSPHRPGRSFQFEIPKVQLGPVDRRVFSSAIESLISKNDELTLATLNFFMDSLIYDYPAEVFLQENSLCMAIVEIVVSSYQETRLQDHAFQCLQELAILLRQKFVVLNSSEFFEPSCKGISMQENSLSYSYGSTSKRAVASTDSCVENLCQILKSLSRTVLFQPQIFNLWRLLDEFSLTVCKLVEIMPVDPKTITLGLQEVLLDLSYCYEKHGEAVSSTSLVLTITSILCSIKTVDEEFVLASNVRQCCRKLLSCSNLYENWPEAHQLFLKTCDSLENASILDLSVDIATSENKRISRIANYLTAVQNATSHQAVIVAVNGIFEFLYPLILKSRSKTIEWKSICTNLPWRESFYRFLCVEPTCSQDEVLLIKVLELLMFLIENLNEEKHALEEWIIPLCMEKGCACLRLLNEHCISQEAGAALSNLSKSLFQAYFILLRSSSVAIENEHIWDLFRLFCSIYHEIGEKNFPVSVLQPISKGIAFLTQHQHIRAQLSTNPKFCIGLIHRIVESILSLQENSNGFSTDSYRNQGVLFYLSLSLVHVTLVVESNNNHLTSDWNAKCCTVVPCIWDSRDPRTRALGFQVCEIITRKPEGLLSTASIFEMPNTIWTTSYNTLFDNEEAAIVKTYACKVLSNMLTCCRCMSENSLYIKSLELPPWTVLDDLTKLLSHVYWQPTLSEVFKLSEESSSIDSDHDKSIQFVTPKVISSVCSLLKEMMESKIEVFHPDTFFSGVVSSGLCPVMFQLIGTHTINVTQNEKWWKESCCALSNLIELLTRLSQHDKNISIMLIGDKRNLNAVIQLLEIQPLSADSEELCLALCVSVMTLLCILCADSGSNFEDFERCIRNRRSVIFLKISQWLCTDSPRICRKTGLNFLQSLLAKLSMKPQEKERDYIEFGHPLLSQYWNECGDVYGNVLVKSLVGLYEETLNHEEKLCCLRTLIAISNLCPEAKLYATRLNILSKLLDVFKKFALQYFDSMYSLPAGKKTLSNWHEEIMCILSVMSTLLYRNMEAKNRALELHYVDVCHKIFKIWKSYPDRSLLHSFLEAMLNYTEDFPIGCQSLVVSSSVIGVGPRKTPNQQSFLCDVLDILHNEISVMDSVASVKTVEIIFEFVTNAVFASECRNILLKNSIMNFITKLNYRDMKKWGNKQHRIKVLYMDFLMRITIHSDIQSFIAKVPDALENLTGLAEKADAGTSLVSLKILRNLCFQSSNRPRFLCDESILTLLSTKMKDSENWEEIETAGVAIWALVNNSEKGKLAARRSLCHVNADKAINKIKRAEVTSNSNDLLIQKQDLSKVLSVLTTLSNILTPVQ